MSCFIKVKKSHPLAVIPTQSIGDVGWDLYAVEECTIPAGETRQVKTGLILADTPIEDDIHKSILIKIEGRSGLALNHSIFPIGGIIDPHYRGEICAILHNGGRNDYNVASGDRIAQIVLYTVHAHTSSSRTSFVEASEVNSTERCQKGFGSSGK